MFNNILFRERSCNLSFICGRPIIERPLTTRCQCVFGFNTQDVIGVGCMQSVPIITNVVNLNSTHGEVYSGQHCVTATFSYILDIL
jgi:hypothetical protein